MEYREQMNSEEVERTERIASLAAGLGLLFFGLKRRGLLGYLLALAGGALSYCGATGKCGVRRLLGQREASQRERTATIPADAIRVEESVIVNRPADELYRYWRDVENHPRFNSTLQKVLVLGDNRSHWFVKGPLNIEMEWVAEITEEVPNQSITWRTLPGGDIEQTGTVRFDPLSYGRGTKVTVIGRYVPPAGILGKAAAKLTGSDPFLQVQEMLRHFKQLMETGEIPTIKGQPSGRTEAGAEARV